MEQYLNIGIVGNADGRFNEASAENRLEQVFEEISKSYGSMKINIISGATLCGIHKMLYPMAERLGYGTIGVMCKKGYDWKLYPVDELYAKGADWGEESELFIAKIDVLYRIGGGTQSRRECQLARQKGIPVYEYELE